MKSHMKQISTEQVKHIAKLSNLTVSGEEDKFSKLLTDTISDIDVLDELDTSGVSPTYQVGGLRNVYQEPDNIPTTLKKLEALSGGSDVEDGLFATKAVLEEKP